MENTREKPSVSVVVTIHNGGPHYPTCFESLCRLAYPNDRLEVHVVDDCSTDGTREFLKRQTPPDFIHRHFPDSNLGRSQACNMALGHTTGEVVIFLDGDMEVQPDFVEQHVAELAKPGREAVVGKVEPASWLPKSKLNRYLYESSLRGPRRFGDIQPLGFQYLIFNNAALSRAAVEAGGTFEESFRHFGGKDILFGYRVAQRFPDGIYYGNRSVSYHHQDRSLDAHLKLLRDYGYHNLPRILSHNPEIANILAADFAWPLTGNYFRHKRLLGRLLFNPITRFLGRVLLPVLPFPISNMLVRFLIVASVVQGLRSYVRNNKIYTQPPAPPASEAKS
ncbi:MAG: glycosyltransferase family 2 protein [Fidelibacterota bacterium]|nr:MAG: glycosyltransferase family 2 protein [Candidatus Neomarinimicrobiota bacterium]